MCQKESWGAIVARLAPKEAHSTQRDQPPRMHGPVLWRYEQMEQRVTPVPMSGVNCDLWCPGWDSKDLEGRPEQDPGYTSRPWHQYEYDPLLEGQPLKYIRHVDTCPVLGMPPMRRAAVRITRSRQLRRTARRST